MIPSATDRNGRQLPPTVSVIIPTHNRAKVLPRAIQSVLDQTRQDFEIIVVSDGSEDNTEEVVESFKDSRVRFLKHAAARGASAARNTGIKAVRGRFIAFLDDDDEWTSNKLEVQVPFIENSGARVGLIYGWMEYLQAGHVVKKRKPTLRGYIFPEMLDKQAISGCPTIMIKQEVLDVVKGFDEELPRGNDGDFIRRITKHFEVDYVPEILCKVHVGHADRISVESKENLKNVVWALKKRLQDFQQDFARYPKQKANVLAQAAVTCFKIGQYQDGFVYNRNMFKWKAGWKHTTCLLCQETMLIVKYLLRRVLYSHNRATK